MIFSGILKKKSCLGSRAGFSLLGAMALMAVVTLVIYAWSKSQARSVKVQNLIRAKRSVQDVRQAFEGRVIQKFRANACFDPAVAFAGTTLGNAGSMSYSTAVMTGVNLASVDSSSMISKLTAARARCGSPRPPGTSASMPANTHRYFCVEFQPGSSAPAGSFMAGVGAFAEVFVESRNFQTGQPIDCDTVNQHTDGATVLYSIYWPGTGSDKNTWQFYNGSMSVTADPPDLSGCKTSTSLVDPEATYRFDSSSATTNFVNSLDGYTKISTAWSDAGCVNASDATALATCKLKGFQASTGYGSKGWHSCHDNYIAVWNPNPSDGGHPNYELKNACTDNKCIQWLECEGRLDDICTDDLSWMFTR